MNLLASKRFLALRCALLIGIGFAVGLLADIPFWVGLVLAVLSIVPVILFSRKFLYLTLFFLAVPYATFSLPSPVPAEAYGTRIEVEGKVTGKTGGYTIISIDSPQPLRKRKLLVYLASKVEQGTFLRVEGELLTLAFPRNPGMPDRNKRLMREGVIGRISTDRVRITLPPNRVRNWFNLTRTWLIKRNQDLFEEQASLFTAILLGEKSSISDELYLDMRRTGTLHLLAVSGLHVGILVAFLFGLMRLTHTPRWLMLPFTTVVVLFYLVLVGPKPSLIRASLMIWAVAVGFTFERKILPLNSLAIAAVLIVLIRPSQVLATSFQLSFAATFAVIVAAYAFKEVSRLKRKIWQKVPKWVTKWVLLPLAISVSATIFTMPILAANFHQITFAAILANLPVIPLVSIGLPLGLLALVLSMIWFPLGKILGCVVFGVLWVVEKVLHYFPGTLINSGTWPIAAVVGMFVVILILHTERNRARRFKHAMLVAVVCANLAVWPWVFASRRPRLTMLDTYHGNVSLLQSDGRVVLLNPGSRAEPTVIDYLRAQGVNRIDWVLCLSDRDGDLSGLDSLRSNFKVENVGSVLASQATTPLPHSGRLMLPSAAIEYDLAMRDRPYYVVESDRGRVVFVSESHLLDTSANINYILNKHIRVEDSFGRRVIFKNDLDSRHGEIIRESGGILLKL